MSLINFQSLTEIENKKKDEREARQNILDKAREKHERKERREKEAQERGETTWMLPSVESKLNPSKKKKKKKKNKKEKKSKKQKKEKKRKRSPSTSSSSSSESEEENPQSSAVWVEKPASQPLKREEWMEVSSLFKTQTREQMKIAEGSSRALKKLEERKRKEEENKPGSHARELNPYYKNDGKGLPSEESSSSCSEVKVSSYDASWLRKALERAKTQAAEEGRSLEEVARDRWGSLNTFYKLLDEAEGRREDRKEGSASCVSETLEKKHKNRYEKEDTRSKKAKRSRSRDRDRRSRGRESRDRRSRKEENRDRESRRNSSESGDSGNGSYNNKNNNNSKFSSENGKNKGRRSRSSSSNSNGKNKGRRSRSSSSSSCSSTSSENRSKHFDDENKYKRRRRSSSSDCSDRRKYIQEKRNINNSKAESQIASRKSNSEKSGRLKMMKPGSDDEFFSPSDRSKSFLKPQDDNIENFSSRQCVTKNYSASWRKKQSEPELSTVEMRRNEKESSSSSSSEDSSNESDSSSVIENIKQDEKQSTKENPSVDVPPLTDKQMNQLAAKLTKAELLGNTDLAEKLKSKLEAARKVRENKKHETGDKGSDADEEQVVVLTRTDKTGFTRPVEAGLTEDRGGRRKKNKSSEMFGPDGKRISYFKDDLKSDLHSMFEKEKTLNTEDEIELLKNLSRYNTEKLSDDFDVDDMFVAKVAPKESGEKERERDRKRAMWEHQKVQKALDNCHFCVDSKLMKKHLIVSLGKKCYMSLPYHQSLTEGHCMIVPLNHVPCATQADEDLWEEVVSFQRALVRMFSSNEEDCIFFESALKLHQTPHMVIHCIPLPRETGELAPIYFKKAILECDEEWAQNKKLIELKGRNVRKAVPKGLPYFYVDFGMTPGFAHVVENERKFPSNFAQEIIGGMIDADISLFRKPKTENFDNQRKKVLKFAEMFKSFDPSETS